MSKSLSARVVKPALAFGLALALVAALSPFTASADAHPFDGEELFRGIYWGQGPAAAQIEAVGTVRAEAMPKEVLVLIDRSVKHIQTSEPTFFDEFAEVLYSGNHREVSEALEAGGQTLAEAIERVVPQQDRSADEIGPACGLLALCVTAVAVQSWGAATTVTLGFGYAAVYLETAFWGPSSIDGPSTLEQERLVQDIVSDLS